MKKTLLILLLALCCLLLTGCYTDNDPWPEANLNGAQPTTPPVVTVVPATAVPETLPPVTPLPATQEPLPEDAVDVSPNLNG